VKEKKYSINVYHFIKKKLYGTFHDQRVGKQICAVVMQRVKRHSQSK